jgi:hypothetical protein
MRIEIGACVVEQARRLGFKNPIAKTLADQPALAIAAVGIETVADHAAAIAHHIRHHRDQARRHFRKIDIGVADRRSDRLGDFGDVDDAHGVSLGRCFGYAGK